MSNYENAPACKLLATHCCACGRPLVDAVSVESGMGPDCRKRYMVIDGLSSIVGSPEEAEKLRSRANYLVWEMAIQISAVHGGDLDQVSRCAVANNLHELRAMGFLKLASKLEAQWVQIRVTEEPDGTYAVKAPYDERSVLSWRRIPGRVWDGRNKVNRVPMAGRVKLWELLIRHFPGFAGMGPKGSFVVPTSQNSLFRAAESDQEPAHVCTEMCDGECDRG